jgi:hypothetical protein
MILICSNPSAACFSLGMFICGKFQVIVSVGVCHQLIRFFNYMRRSSYTVFSSLLWLFVVSHCFFVCLAPGHESGPTKHSECCSGHAHESEERSHNAGCDQEGCCQPSLAAKGTSIEYGGSIVETVRGENAWEPQLPLASVAHHLGDFPRPSQVPLVLNLTARLHSLTIAPNSPPI